jgi:hypothetical protein
MGPLVHQRVKGVRNARIAIREGSIPFQAVRDSGAIPILRLVAEDLDDPIVGHRGQEPLHDLARLREPDLSLRGGEDDRIAEERLAPFHRAEVVQSRGRGEVVEVLLRQPLCAPDAERPPADPLRMAEEPGIAAFENHQEGRDRVQECRLRAIEHFGVGKCGPDRGGER